MVDLPDDILALIHDIEPHEFVPASIPYDKFLWLHDERVDAFVEKVAEEIAIIEQRRKRDPKTNIRFLFAIKSLLLNLFKTMILPNQLSLAVPLNANHFTLQSRYGQKCLTYSTFRAAHDGLINLGYAKVLRKGFRKTDGKGQRTRIGGTSKLRKIMLKDFAHHWPASEEAMIFFSRHESEETIILKEDKRKGQARIPYHETALSKTMRENLQRINEHLNKHWYDLDLSGAEFKKLLSEMKAENEESPAVSATIDFSSKSLYRVFNNGKGKRHKDNFTEGGRFYGGWWINLKSEYRKYITIDGKRTVEIDFSSMHPSMLYAIIDKRYDGDAYRMPSLPSNHFINSGEGRKVLKGLFQRLINGNRFPSMDDDYLVDKVGLSWKSLVLQFMERHEPIRQFFNTGYGVKLMALDSRIAEAVMLSFVKKGRPILPVHDSFLVHRSLGDELKEEMAEAFRQVMKQEAGFKSKNYHEMFMKEIARQLETGEHQPYKEMSPDDILSIPPRLGMWWEYQRSLRESCPNKVANR